MVGDSSNACKRYSEIFGDPPSWGLNGGNDDTSMHIMCCKQVDSAGDTNVGSGGVDAGTVTETSQAAATPKPTPKPTPAPIVDTAQAEEDFNMASDEYAFAETYQPVWFDRDHTWTGQTWDEADAFCKSKQNARLCPYEVYCPTGPNHLPYGGVRPESTVWAPMSDSRNSWVSVSGQNTCVTYMVLNLINPSWGLTGQDNEEMTRHVMCCRDPNDVVASDGQDSNVAVSDVVLENLQSSAEAIASDAVDTTASDAGATSSVQPTPMSDENRDKLYQAVSKEYKPMAFTRERGWTGQTYTSALMFCAAQESKILCPYMVVCPLGPNGMPVSGMLHVPLM